MKCRVRSLKMISLVSTRALKFISVVERRIMLGIEGKVGKLSNAILSFGHSVQSSVSSAKLGVGSGRCSGGGGSNLPSCPSSSVGRAPGF